MKRKRLIAGCIGLAVLVILGLGTRTTVCASCEGQGPIDLTWYGMRVLSYGDRLFDEYGSVELWELVYGRPCTHEWRAWITVSAGGRRVSGDFLVWGDRAAALRGLAKENREWARLAWESVRRMPFEAQSLPRSRLEELGAVVWDEEHRVKPGSRDVVVAWWHRNQDWIQPR